MRRLTKILFAFSGSFMLVFLLIGIVRLSKGKDAYFGFGATFTYFETYDGKDNILETMDKIQYTIDNSFKNWQDFEFVTNGVGDFFQNLGTFFTNVWKSTKGIFELVIYTVHGVVDFSFYNIRFLIGFLDYAYNY